MCSANVVPVLCLWVTWYPTGCARQCPSHNHKSHHMSSAHVLNYKSQHPPSKPHVLFICSPRILFIFFVFRAICVFFFICVPFFVWLYFRNNFGNIFGTKSTAKLARSALEHSPMQQCPTVCRGLIPLCPEPPERRCLTRRTARRTDPTFSYSSPPVQMRSASSVR